MDNQEFKTKTINVLRGHTNKLDTMENAIRSAVERASHRYRIRKDVLKEISSTSEECRRVLEFYYEQDPLPEEVRIAMANALEALNHCADAFTFFMAGKKSQGCIPRANSTSRISTVGSWPAPQWERS